MSRHRDFQDLCRRWRDAPFLCLDTEFVRTRTFFARLGLVQVNDDSETVLLDAVALTDRGPLRDLLAGYERDVVLHSCGEDLGIFAHELGLVPKRVFDTQIVASLLGLGFSLSYQALVQKLLGEDVIKGETRSDWTARPLRQAQLRYAASDVEHLPAVYRRLSARLDETGRREWAREELAQLSDIDRYRIEPRDGWRRVRGAGG
ncbi:MAG: ribonuclease D, partial [Acidobacteriota bacterium]|nr:ribonuclease D [Acidobacteriota bacterium]